MSRAVAIDRDAGEPRSLQGDVLRVLDADSVQWDEVCDVAVLGYGGAGICASLELAEAGADVIAIDRFSGGGATAFSGGVVYAGGTEFQAQAGFDDDSENMANYLQLEVGDAVSRETLKQFCQDSSANLDWLRARGVRFGSKVYEGKTTYPPPSYDLQYCGNEKVEVFASVARPVPRGHRAKGKGFTGRFLYAALRKAADASAIRFRPHTIATRLIVDDRDRVVGAEALTLPEGRHASHQALYDAITPTVPFKEERAERKNRQARELERQYGERFLIRARHGVIIATGGYVFDLDLLREFVPLLAQHYKTLTRLGSIGDDGSSVRLGRSVGARLRRMDSMFVGRVLAPPAAFLDGILVNREGCRFVNEAIYLGRLGQAIADQPGGKAWLVLSTADLRKAVWQVFRGGMHAFKLFGAPALLNIALGGTQRASDAVGLAQKCGMDPQRLAATISHYDNLVAEGRDSDYSKLAQHLKPLGGRSLTALNVSLDNKYSFLQLLTLGGLAVDEVTGMVLREDGSRVEGLYAAGRAAAGLPSNGYISGLSLADCIFSGRRAARACLDGAALKGVADSSIK